MSYSSYIVRRLRYSGLTRLVLEVFAKFGFNLRPFVLFREGLFNLTSEDPVPGLDGYEMKYLGAEDMTTIAALAGQPGRNIPEDDLHQRLLAGNSCLAAFQNEEMAAFIWCDLNYCTFPAYPFAIKDNEAYLFDAYTFQPFRGKGLAPALRYRLYQDLAKAGRDNCYSITDSLNRPSIKFKQKLKAQKVISGVYLVLFHRWHFTLFLKRHVQHVPLSSARPRHQ